MQWYKLASNPQILSDLYTDVPVLQEVDLIEVMLTDGGTQMSLKIILPRFPENPPTRWIESGYNTVQIQVDFLGLEEVTISRWSTVNLVDAQIEMIANGQIALNIQSLSCSIQAKAHSFSISKIVGYLMRPKTL